MSVIIITLAHHTGHTFYKWHWQMDPLFTYIHELAFTVCVDINNCLSRSLSLFLSLSFAVCLSQLHVHGSDGRSVHAAGSQKRIKILFRSSSNEIYIQEPNPIRLHFFIFFSFHFGTFVRYFLLHTCLRCCCSSSCIAMLCFFGCIFAYSEKVAQNMRPPRIVYQSVCPASKTRRLSFLLH